MLDIEDLIVKLGSAPVKINAWDQQLIRSFADQINRGSGFTEKQGTLALKMLKKHSVVSNVFHRYHQFFNKSHIQIPV